MAISDRRATPRRRSGLVALIAGVAILGLVVPLGA